MRMHLDWWYRLATMAALSTIALIILFGSPNLQ
jgi:hypothetical protein